MITASLKAIIGITAILAGWLAVQHAWRSATGSGPEDDPLGGRLGCTGCQCHGTCQQEGDLASGLTKKQHIST